MLRRAYMKAEPLAVNSEDSRLSSTDDWFYFGSRLHFWDVNKTGSGRCVLKNCPDRF